MKVAILHDTVSPDRPLDQTDVFVQIEMVDQALIHLGHRTKIIGFSLQIGKVVDELSTYAPEVVFNLVESVEGDGQLIHLAPAILEHLRLPYTGCPLRAMFLSTDKILAKKYLRAAGLLTPPWVTLEEATLGLPLSPPYIVKSIQEDASIGLDDLSVVSKDTPAAVEIRQRAERFGGDGLPKPSIDGREFNLSILEGESGPELLPPAEIQFTDYPEGKPQIVGYSAKWEASSFEYQNTPRTFTFSQDDRSLLDRLSTTALIAWELFEFRGYGRVDFRVGSDGTPWVLELNANPCLSPGAGFLAACSQKGASQEEVIATILSTALRKSAPQGGKMSSKTLHTVQTDGLLQFRQELKPNDGDAVRTLAETTGFFFPEEIDIAVELVEERLSKGASSGYSFWIAEINGQMAGYACFGPVACTKSSFDLYWIIVRDELRGYGIGKKLLKLCDEFREREWGDANLYRNVIRELYEPTRQFYLRNQCTEEARLKDFYDIGR